MDVLGCNGGASGPAQAALTLTLVDQADPVMDGDTYTYTIQVANVAATTATTLALTFVVDAGLTIVSKTGTGWALSQVGNTITATLASLATGAADPIVVTVTAPGSALAASSTATITATNAPTNNVTETTAVVLVTKDGNNAWRYPATFQEWQALMWTVGVGPPQFDWLNQDVATPLTDIMQGETLAEAAAPTYGNVVAGWNAKFIGTTDATLTQGWSCGTGFGWNCNTQPVLFMNFFRLSADAARRCFLMFGGNQTGRLDLLSGGKFQIAPGSTNGLSNHIGAVDRAAVTCIIPGAGIPGYSGAGTLEVATTLEHIVGTWNSSISGSGNKGIAAAGVATVSAPTCLYAGMPVWVGAGVQTIFAFGLKPFMQRFGITIPW